MIDPRREEQLHEMLEGRLGEPALADLRQALARDPALRERADELEAAFAALADATSVDPPPGLREDILRTVRSEPHRRGAISPAPRPWLRLALPLAAAACGLAVVAVLVIARNPRGPGLAPVQGTIGDATVEPAAVPATQRFSAHGARGTYSVSPAPDGGVIFAVDSQGKALDLDVAWPAGAVRSTALLSPSPDTPDLAVEAHPEGFRMHLPARTGARVRLLGAHRNPLVLHVDVRVGSHPVQSASVSTSPEENR
jgi:hypothetical protein